MSSKTTIDHAEIRNWVEARGGGPAHVKGTGRRRSDPGILRIDYEGFNHIDALEPIAWDVWFASFDAHKLAFLYDTNKKSRFSKLISRPSPRATAKRVAKTHTTRTPAKKRMAKRRTTAKRRSVRARAA